MIYITTSVSLMRYDPATDRVETVCRPRKSLGFFGVCQGPDGVYAASRERLSEQTLGKASSDVRLYRVVSNTGIAEEVRELYEVHDVHQMEYHDGLLFLTDTALDRVHVYELATNRLVRIINLGPQRRDTHHVNAVLMEGENLLVGLNNRGHRDSAILTLPMEAIRNGGPVEVDGFGMGPLRELTGIHHTHDLERYKDWLLCCASHAGQVLRTDTGEVIAHTEGWTRGLAVTDEGLWVGVSPLAKRSQRHKSNLDGKLLLFRHGDFDLLREIPLEGSGQVCDLLYSPVG